MAIFKKIKAFFKEIKVFIRKKPVSKPLTRFQFYSKIASLFICAIGLDMSGQRVFNFDSDYAYGRITYAQYQSVEYTYYMAISGLFLGLAFWKLLELYWLGKDALLVNRQTDV